MKTKIILFFILLFVFSPRVSSAMAMVPYSNITIIVNTQGSDSSFNFNVKEQYGDCSTIEDKACTYPFRDYENFVMTTNNLTASRSETLIGGYYIIKEENSDGLKVSSIFCISDNPKDVFWYKPDSVEIAVDGWSDIICSFNNVKSKTPVLIVPGLLGTEMKSGSQLLWPDIGKMAISSSDSFMDNLQFGINLSSSVESLMVGGVIKKLETALGLVNFDYIEGLLTEFKNQGYISDANLFTFPYDWRYGVSGKYSDGTTNVDLLAQKIKGIMSQTGSDKVDVVAHSMGGLIVKKYVMDNSADNHIGKAVFVGVPNTGSPKAIKVLLQGDNFGIPWLNDAEIKKISANMPASYDLLPTQQYYNAKGSFVKKINQDIFNLTYSDKDLNYSEAKSFLIDEHKLNSLAQANAENLHTQAYDNFDLRTAGVDLYSINGCKAGTIAQIVERKDKDMFGGTETNYNMGYGGLPMTRGDNTVPLESATNLPINQSNKYYALVSDHGKMPSENGIRQQIVNLISGSSLSTTQGNGNPLITQDIAKCELNGKAISVFSPIDIFVTDQFGNKLGLASDGSVINEIPNADFEIMGEHKFFYLPQDEGQVYSIAIKGTDTGSYTIKSQDIQNSQATKTEVFSNLPVTTALTGQVVLSPTNNTTTLSVKQNETDALTTILPSSILDSSKASDLLPPVSKAEPSGTAGQTGFYRSDVSVAIKAIDETSGVLAVNYNLDNTGYKKITADSASIVIAPEGKHTITFFSTDKAGNNESEQSLTFTIDKTAPESMVQFDQVTKDLKFTGTDNVTETSLILVQDNDDVIILTDQAGNTTEIKLKDKNRKTRMSAEIKSLKYNGILVDISKNLMDFNWFLDKKKNFTMLFQHVQSKNGYNISAVYNGKTTKLLGKDASGKILTTVSGLKIIKISTNKGDLRWGW